VPALLAAPLGCTHGFAYPAQEEKAKGIGVSARIMEDVFELLLAIPRGSVDCVLTSPPFRR
jgi:hypothetical protein